MANKKILYPVRVERKVIVTLSDERRLSGCVIRLSPGLAWLFELIVMCIPFHRFISPV